MNRRKLFSSMEDIMPHARNIANAPLSVQENIWPFIETGRVEWFNAGDVATVARGLF
jgi:hypothetical protein